MDAMAGWKNRTVKQSAGGLDRSGHLANVLSFTVSFATLPYPTLEFNILEEQLYDSRIRYDTPAMTIVSQPFDVPRYDSKAVLGIRALSVSPSPTEVSLACMTG